MRPTKAYEALLAMHRKIVIASPATFIKPSVIVKSLDHINRKGESMGTGETEVGDDLWEHLFRVERLPLKLKHLLVDFLKAVERSGAR